MTFDKDTKRLHTVASKVLSLETENRRLVEELAAANLVIERMRQVVGIANQSPLFWDKFEKEFALQPSTEALAARDSRRDAVLLIAVAKIIESFLP